MKSESLQHYGVLGMKWGVRRTKAQLSRARGTPSKTRKVTKEVYEAEKKKAINSGDPKKVSAWKTKLSNQELKDAIDRCKLTKDLADVEAKNKKSGLEKVEDAVSKVGRATKIVTTTYGFYNAVAKVNNTFSDKKIPIVGEKSPDKKKED